MAVVPDLAAGRTTGVVANITFNISGGDFAGNHATLEGGIFIEASSSASIQGSTFSQNSAVQGAGIFTGGQLMIKNSSLTQNSASVAGGGIYICVECGGTASLKHTTVTENTPDDIFP